MPEPIEASVSLHLSDHRIRKIREVQELFVAPPDRPGVERWAEAVHSAVSSLFGTERSLLILPRGGPDDMLVHAFQLDERTVRGFREAMAGTGAQVNEYNDPLLDRAMRRLAKAGVRVWSARSAEQVTRIRLAEMPRLYPELIQPGRLEEHVGMTHPLPEGQALFHVFADPGGATRLNDEVLQMFHLLLPTFGVTAVALATGPPGDVPLRAALDAAGGAAALYRNGAELYRSAALRDLLRSEECRDDLVAAMLHHARRFAGASNGCDLMSAVDVAPRFLEAPGNRYRLTATPFEPQTEGCPTTVMVSVRAALPPFPERAHLVERYRLTTRQADVALLLAQGMTNREIADRIGVSEHTARHHAQRVLEKVGTGTRKALAIRLLADRDL
jgi:DNA-binding CsgD family transcriptional regulator